MLSKSRLILTIALTVIAVGAPAASAAYRPGDVRGEHAVAQSESVSAPSAGLDLRSPDAVEPFVRPVIIEIDEPAAGGFDWSAGAIGLGAGAALVLLTTAGVLTGRRRHAGPTTV